MILRFYERLSKHDRNETNRYSMLTASQYDFSSSEHESTQDTGEKLTLFNSAVFSNADEIESLISDFPANKPTLVKANVENRPSVGLLLTSNKRT